MFTAIGLVIRQICATLTMLFSATEKSAKALDHLANWAEKTAEAFSDEAKIGREANLAKLLKQSNLQINASGDIEDATAKVKAIK